jgi:hypothetical protein
MRLLLALILATAVGAASPPKAIDSDPVSLITAIYQTYLDNTELLTGIYSKRLQALLDKDAQETPEGMVGRIDWDVFVDGQDFALKELKIVPVSQDETKAQIRGDLHQYGRPEEHAVRPRARRRPLAHRRDRGHAPAALLRVEDPRRRSRRVSRRRCAAVTRSRPVIPA